MKELPKTAATCRNQKKPNKFSFRSATRQRQRRVIKVSNWLNWKEDKGEGKRGNDVGEQAAQSRKAK